MKILVAYDGSISADAAIDDLQRAGLPANAEVLVLCVEDGGLQHAAGRGETASHGAWKDRPAEAERFAEKAGARIKTYFPQWTVSAEAKLGTPAKTVLETSGWWHPDLIVAGSHGRSRVARLFLGSVSLELIHHAPCSVRVARAGPASATGKPIRLIIGIDGSPEALAVVRSVAARRWPENTEAHVISVVETLVPAVAGLGASTLAQEPASRVIREVDERERGGLRKVADDSADVLRRAGLAVTSTVIDGDPRDVILEQAGLCGADAIFVGARGHGRMERLLLGSVSTHILTHAPCTVEVVRHAALQ